jgi:hypothetical protein
MARNWRSYFVEYFEDDEGDNQGCQNGRPTVKNTIWTSISSRRPCVSAITPRMVKYKWFNINRFFLALGEVVGKEAFQSHMRRLCRAHTHRAKITSC